MAGFDAKKLSRLDWFVVGAALVTFIALFLPWYGASAGGFSASVSGWSTSYGWLGALLIIVSGAYLFLLRSGVQLPKMPVGPAVFVLGTAVIGTVIVGLRWATLPRGSGGVSGIATYSYGPRAGIYIALIAGIVQAVYALRLFRASSETLPWAKSGTPTPDGGGPARA
jgi:hypothetical protein